MWFGQEDVRSLSEDCRVAAVGGTQGSKTTSLLFGVILRMVDKVPPKFMRVGNTYFRLQSLTKSVLLRNGKTPEYIFVR